MTKENKCILSAKKCTLWVMIMKRILDLSDFTSDFTFVLLFHSWHLFGYCCSQFSFYWSHLTLLSEFESFTLLSFCDSVIMMGQSKASTFKCCDLVSLMWLVYWKKVVIALNILNALRVINTLHTLLMYHVLDISIYILKLCIK